MNYKYKLGFVGCGNMAKAIINGLLDSHFLFADEMLVSTPNINTPYNGIAFSNDNKYVLDNCEYVVIAVKPQIYRAIEEQFADCSAKCLISIMAGVNTATIKKASGCEEVVRIMPNTPCSIKEGVSAITTDGASEQSFEFVERVFGTISSTVRVDESYFDAVTSISGSGPAYVYYFIKAVTDAGVEGGLSYEQSKQLALKTFIGASKMVENSTDSLDALIDKVCSKGGTTIQAIDTFRQTNVAENIKLGIEKCRKRSEELSKG